MVFLKRTMLLFLCLWGGMLYAQSESPLNKAFVKSFTLEEKQNYNAAAETLLKVYQKNSYETNLRIGWLLYKANKYKESIIYYTRAINLMPYSIEAKLGASLPESSLNLWDSVLQLYGDVLMVDSKNTKALYNTGLIYYNRGSYIQALRYFKELHNLYPTDYDAIFMHGWTNIKMGKLREAKVIFNQLLLLYPDDESGLEAIKILE